MNNKIVVLECASKLLKRNFDVFACISALISLDLAPGPAGPFSLQRPKGVWRSVHALHWRVFRALEPAKPAENRLATRS